MNGTSTKTKLPGYSDSYYDDVLEAIKTNPESVIAEKRLDQIASLKLYIPEQIKAHRKLRRHKYEQFEAALKETETRKAEIALEIKTARDPNNKILYANKEARESELFIRLAKDPEYNRWNKLRAVYYSDAKSAEEECDYLERIDISLLEIIAMFSAQIDNRRHGKNGTSLARKTRRTTVSGKNGTSTSFSSERDSESTRESI
jgi:hypothetical protein